MDKQELQVEMKMDYDTLVKYLQDKYGCPERAYFRTQTCKTKSPIQRSGEGLFVHHVKELEIDDLSKTERALEAPWEYQEPYNLCYCNYLEHLLLHILINEIRCHRWDSFIEDGIVHYLVPSINSAFRSDIVYKQEWRNRARAVIIDNYNEYKELLFLWLNKIKKYNIRYYIEEGSVYQKSYVTIENLLGLETLNDTIHPKKIKRCGSIYEYPIRRIEDNKIYDNWDDALLDICVIDKRGLAKAIKNHTEYRNYHWELYIKGE